MQLSLNALQVYTIYAGRNAEAIHEPLQGEWMIYQTNRGGRWKSRFTRIKVLKSISRTLCKVNDCALFRYI